MKTIIITLTIILISISSIKAQFNWLEAKTNQNGLTILYDQVSNIAVSQSHQKVLINYNPSVTISKPIQLNLSKKGLAQTSIFTVFKPKLNTNEELIWQIQNKHTDQLLLTDERVADFSQGRFMNFLDHNPREAQINSYQHYRSEFDADQLIIGGNPSNAEVPVRAFEGELAEMIVFDHKLAPVAQQIVESHLAIKYSIPLSEGVDYVDDLGRPLWKYESHKDYAHNIAGLGRNDELHLHQKQSMSKLGEGSISFGIGEINETNPSNPNQLQNQEYLMWGDDNGILDFEEEYQEVYRLTRSWKVIGDRFGQAHQLAFDINHNGIAQEVDGEQNLWLMLSENELDNRQLHSTSLYQLNPTKDGFSTNGIDITGKSFFTLIKTPKLWLQLESDEPECGIEATGSISYIPAGGEAPYDVSLNDMDGNLIQNSQQDQATIETFTNLSPAQYTIKIEDHKGLTWSTSIYLNSSDMPIIDLPKKLILDGDESAFLNGNSDSDEQLDYLWTTPNGSTSTRSQIEANDAGIYTLQISQDDCHAWHKVEVVKEENNIEYTQVNPNPTTNGYFTFKGKLKEAAPFSIAITTVDGMVVRQQDFDAAKYVSFDGRMEDDGAYFITLRTGKSVRTEKLMVVR